MNNITINKRMSKIKKMIESLINEGNLEEAEKSISEYEKVVNDDVDIYSMKAIIFIMQGKLDDAEMLLKQGLSIDDQNFDLNYNLGYVYERQDKFSETVKFYKRAVRNCKDEKMKADIAEFIQKISSEHHIEPIEDKKKIAFFVKQGMDSFLGGIINGLSDEYETKKVVVTQYNQIDKEMKWADICWFEWCDELIGYGSKLELAKQKKIICRIHGYEVYTNFIRQTNWKNVNNLIIVAPHIRRIFEENTKDINKGNLKIDTIFCGVNMSAYLLNIKKKGFNLGYIGYINFKKNLPLTFDIFKKLHDMDNRYKLYLAGEIQDARTWAYLNYFVKEHNLSESVQFDGWQDLKHKIKWFEKIDYMVISSIDEGLCYAAAEAMSSGIKPILHNCEGIKDHYDKKYIFSTLDEAVNMITSNEYDSQEYRNFIEDNYSLEKQMEKIKNIMNELYIKSRFSNIIKFNYDKVEVKFYLPYLNDWIENIIYKTNNFYEENMLKDIKNRLGKNKVIVDVGANIGNHTIFLSKICRAKKVYSFEPQANIFKILKKNIEINNISNVVKLYNIGLGNNHCFAEVKVKNKNNFGMSSLYKANKGTVEINSLDSIFIDKNIKVDMIKIDVEGMEMEVLKGAKIIIKKFKPLIYIEAETSENFKCISKFLGVLNYKPIYKFNATPTYLFICN